jgi:16S rRNA processing protein RimM
VMSFKPQAKNRDRVCLGLIVRPHGVRGLVRIKPYTADPKGVGAYGAVEDESAERQIKLSVVNVAKGMVTAKIEGVTDRDQAEAMRGTELWVPRSVLPEPAEEEFYHHDLVGLRAEGKDGVEFATVKAVENFGAGNIVELQWEAGPTAFVPFTKEFVPVIDIPGGRIVVDPVPDLKEADQKEDVTQDHKDEEDHDGE